MLSNRGVSPDAINNLLKANPELSNLNSDVWEQSMNLFANQGFTTESYLRIINRNPKVLTTPDQLLCKNLELWRASQFGERYVQILVTEHPHLLSVKVENAVAEQRILERIEYLKDYVHTRKNVWRLLLNSPNVIADKISEVKAKRAFFEDTMRVEHTDVVKTAAFSHTLFKIKLRHEFLSRLGMYKPRSLKSDPTLKSTNPSLYQILDTSDKRFATKVALVTTDEYEVFQDLYKREQDRKAGHDVQGSTSSSGEDDSSSDDEE